MEAEQRVRAFFTQHAQAYAVSTSHRQGADLEMLLQLLEPAGGQRALDVATATGHTAFRIAREVAEVVGLDFTPAMREPFERLAREQGIRNARFVVGDAQRLPFAGGTFDIVTSRRAPHHFPRVEGAMAEAARVLKAGGRLGIADMAPPEDPGALALHEALEKARDGSHVRAYTATEWRRLVEQAGLRLVRLDVEEEHMPWARWLYPVAPDGQEAARAEAILAGASPEAAAKVVEEHPDGRRFVKRRVVLVAEKGR